MASISSPGVGSGLDVNSLVTQLMAVERKPLEALLQRQSGLNAKISALGTVKSAIDSLKTAAAGISTASTFTTYKATVGDAAVANVTAGTTAAAGTYSLDVVKLAQSHVVSTAASPAIVAGTLSIKVGANAAVDMAVLGTDTVSGLATKINNDATLKTQVKASVIDNRLVLESVSSGAANKITVNGVAADNSTGLNGFDTNASVVSAAPTLPLVAGKLSITVGSGPAVDIAVDDQVPDTVATLVAKINSDPTLGSKLKASESSDGKLVLESLNSFESFSIDGQETGGGAGLDAFDSGTVSSPMSESKTAQDAQVKINGITLTRSSNTITDAITGLTLNLTKESAGTATTLKVARDAASMSTAVEGFVKAFNEANSTLRRLTAYDPASKTAAALNGDAVARSVQAQLRAALTTVPSALSSNAYKQLVQLGVTTKADGGLSFDATKLTTAFDKNSEATAKAVAAYGAAIETASRGLVATGGLISGRVNGLNASVKDIDSRSLEIERRLGQTENRLRTQFSSLDTLVSSMNKTSSFLSQQLANLPKL